MSVSLKENENKKGWKQFLSFRYIPPVFISLILISGHLSFGILESYLAITVAITTSIITELILSRLILGKWKNITSAYITGISVSILIRSTHIWPFALASVISIMSKYVLQYKGRHIWNPSNFGISWLLFFVPSGVAGLSIQWGNNLLPMIIIWILGIFIVLRAKRIYITVSYVSGFIFFSFLRSLILNVSFFTEVAPLTGPMYQLFVFFMITDPATTVSNKNRQVLFAFSIAFVEFILRLNQFIYAPFYALFLIGPIFYLINKKSAGRSPVKTATI